MIDGLPAIESLRIGTSETGLQTKDARRRLSFPRSWYWIPLAVPVHSGLLFRQDPERPQSSSASSHLLQRPPAPRVRKNGTPGPCQCRPTMSNRCGAAAAASERPPGWGGTSRLTIVTSAAAAAGASASATSAETRNLIGSDPWARVARTPFGGKGARPFPDRIFTTVKGRLLRGFLLAVAVLALAGPAQAASPPRVLAIRFGPDLEINPVTQDYFTHQLDRAAKDGYDAAVIELDTPGGLSSSMKTMYQDELRSK